MSRLPALVALLTSAAASSERLLDFRLGATGSCGTHARRQLLAKAAMAASLTSRAWGGSVPVGWRAAFMVREDQRPHPGRTHGRGIGLEDAADNSAVAQQAARRRRRRSWRGRRGRAA
jgi:hypothetical protein